MDHDSQTCFQNHEVQFISHRTPFHDACENEEQDDDEKVDLAGIKDIPREALAILLNWLVGEPTRHTAKRWRKCTLKVAAVSHMLNIQGLRELSLEQLGKQLGTTRANLSLYSLAVCDSAGIDKTFTGKARKSREVFSETTRAYHERAGHKMKKSALTISNGMQSS